MLQTYCADSLRFNTIHESVIDIIHSVVDHVVSGTNIPEWAILIPEGGREYLSSRRKLKRLINELSELANNYSEEELNCALAFIDSENQIESLLRGDIEIPTLDDHLNGLKAKLAEIFEEGFALLNRTGLREKHYKEIYDSLHSKTCPFCGYMPLDSDGLKNEDLDHYLDRVSYISAAANLQNLIPTCGKCNSRYKGSKNILFDNQGTRRRAFNPYGEDHGDICLRESDPLGGPASAPQWEIALVPECEETRTWDAVF